MLRSGNDPLKEKRKELIKSEFYVPNDGAGYLYNDPQFLEGRQPKMVRKN